MEFRCTRERWKIQTPRKLDADLTRPACVHHHQRLRSCINLNIQTARYADAKHVTVLLSQNPGQSITLQQTWIRTQHHPPCLHEETHINSIIKVVLFQRHNEEVSQANDRPSFLWWSTKIGSDSSSRPEKEEDTNACRSEREASHQGWRKAD